MITYRYHVLLILFIQFFTLYPGKFRLEPKDIAYIQGNVLTNCDEYIVRLIDGRRIICHRYNSQKESPEYAAIMEKYISPEDFESSGAYKIECYEFDDKDAASLFSDLCTLQSDKREDTTWGNYLNAIEKECLEEYQKRKEERIQNGWIKPEKISVKLEECLSIEKTVCYPLVDNYTVYEGYNFNSTFPALVCIKNHTTGLMVCFKIKEEKLEGPGIYIQHKARYLFSSLLLARLQIFKAKSSLKSSPYYSFYQKFQQELEEFKKNIAHSDS